MSERWVACDWGTSSLRVWAMEGATALDEAHSARGMGTLAPEQFAEALDEVAPAEWSGPVIACGMVGARQGWVEAAYAAVPCPPLPDGLTRAPGAREVLIIPGLSQSDPPDVMRGEETQVAGFLALNPGWDGVLCLPGTHTKWVHVSAGEVVSFRTAMTGEMFALLSTRSVLRHSMEEGWSDEAFLAAADVTLSRPERLLSDLFALRAGALLTGAGDARARLSGLLIGAELAATRPFWLGQQVAVIGADALARSYVTALDAQGAPATQAKGDAVTLAGLTAAWRRWKGET
ncbi:putative 2-dehydro-3-deoxygalactonokinase [Oceanicola granulosus HTCC2516]|uniref:Putative 2-dehydro-3-deoxygalactonokinase n=1 Tax=Oceanicola granulosus (strain ATCC BAA-861 / DSM 15982 / KCTC 12143 / HTCC2516) TaxID=314256 RepID=Q2CB39_OCEGH|nr:2-dehydro-3-deoxygalactonokinase [Oceanicola granulosus]EAR49891.1 putative 2-dehydro-3-deoxygalactonokinase [Oceanicola granulosus HTCC2516]